MFTAENLQLKPNEVVILALDSSGNQPLEQLKNLFENFSSALLSTNIIGVHVFCWDTRPMNYRYMRSQDLPNYTMPGGGGTLLSAVKEGTQQAIQEYNSFTDADPNAKFHVFIATDGYFSDAVGTPDIDIDNVKTSYILV